MPWLEQVLLPRVWAYLSGAAALNDEEHDALASEVLRALGLNPEDEAAELAAMEKRTAKAKAVAKR